VSVGRRRRYAGWAIVIVLSIVELVALFYGKPSELQRHPAAMAFVTVVGYSVPMVQAFTLCSAAANVGSGFMLALNVVFFPLKLAAIYLAHPRRFLTYSRGLRGAFAGFYALLIGLVALVPTYIYGWMLAPGDYALPSLERKVSALCSGGVAAFLTATLQSGFALLCSYAAVVILVGAARNLLLIGRSTSNIR
jgi:hypothetical protein